VPFNDHDMNKWMAEINLTKGPLPPPKKKKEERRVCKIVPSQMATWFACAVTPTL
jgi:hypothetical protein